MLRHLKLLQSLRFWILLAALLIVATLIGVDGKITRWIDGPQFVEMMDKETSKGMKFEAHYAPISRVGILGLKADSFTGTNGQKTIVSLEAHEITGWFNPMGFFLQRWQLDDLHIKNGTVMLQKTEGTPGKAKWRPWWGWFWPYRVHLEDIKVDDADALWQLEGKESGIYHAFLEVTPNGHDFEYDAKGGDFKTPMTPTLGLRHLHMLIRKPRLYCDEFLLGDDPAHPEETLRVHGDAGLQEDRSMKATADVTSLKVSPWLPEKWRDHVSGNFSGHMDYSSTGTGLETAQGQGHFSVANGVVSQLDLVKRYVALTKCPDPGDMQLKVCETDVNFMDGAMAAENIHVECPGVFRLDGDIRVSKDKTLSGVLHLGMTDPYIKWLPTAKTAIFTQDDGDYHVASIQLSGTSKKPAQDLTTRVTAEIAKSPGTGFKLFFNQVGDWFDTD
jgi:hypothetical protein